ncbi:unnamed protein product [Amoebophrya sp. A25]|nr:unnamed protein product [Amoebophrya sp. A25]|eukprot:GSA25T00008684001.1
MKNTTAGRTKTTTGKGAPLSARGGTPASASGRAPPTGPTGTASWSGSSSTSRLNYRPPASGTTARARSLSAHQRPPAPGAQDLSRPRATTAANTSRLSPAASSSLNTSAASSVVSNGEGQARVKAVGTRKKPPAGGVKKGTFGTTARDSRAGLPDAIARSFVATASNGPSGIPSPSTSSTASKNTMPSTQGGPAASADARAGARSGAFRTTGATTSKKQGAGVNFSTTKTVRKISHDGEIEEDAASEIVVVLSSSPAKPGVKKIEQLVSPQDENNSAAEEHRPTFPVPIRTPNQEESNHATGLSVAVPAQHQIRNVFQSDQLREAQLTQHSGGLGHSEQHNAPAQPLPAVLNHPQQEQVDGQQDVNMFQPDPEQVAEMERLEVELASLEDVLKHKTSEISTHVQRLQAETPTGVPLVPSHQEQQTSVLGGLGHVGAAQQQLYPPNEAVQHHPVLGHHHQPHGTQAAATGVAVHHPQHVASVNILMVLLLARNTTLLIMLRSIMLR